MNSGSQNSCASLGVILRRSRDALWARMEYELQQAGETINFSQYIVLKTLSAGQAQSNELAKVAGINPGAMTRVIDSLILRKLVKRQPHATDRRVWLVELTKEGRKLWETVNHCGQSVLKTAFGGISKVDQKLFESTLTRIIGNLQDIPEGKE